MGMNGYTTAEELQTAKKALIEAMPGWKLPSADALGVANRTGQVEWIATNHGGIHGSPAVALSTMTGYRAGSTTYRLDLDEFRAALEVLRPAGACDHYEHPNQLRAELNID